MLPPGYVINKDKGAAAKDSDESEEELTFEEKIE